MGKSYKKNPIKKIKGNNKDEYWSKVRAQTKTIMRSKHYTEIDEELLPDPKEIVNDYDYIDTIIIDENNPKFKRK